MTPIREPSQQGAEPKKATKNSNRASLLCQIIEL